MSKVYIKTFGCQMNEYDSERMAGVLEGSGFEKAETEENADFIIVNTCSVRKHAEERAISYIGNRAKKKKVIVAGCMAQNLKEDIIKRVPEVYAVLGTSNFTKIGNVIKNPGNRIFTDAGPDEYGLKVSRGESIRGFTAVMQGCDNFCSYCIVPYVRGRERSRSAGDILNELAVMAEQGFKEVMLLGQNVNSYKDGDTDFPGLLYKAVKTEGIERIRFMTSHPKDLSRELVEAVASEKKLCGHFHLPVQSGSDKILEKMNRKYTAEEYMDKLSMIRKMVKDVSITTDILTGFSYEEKKDFMETVELVKKAEFDDAFVFKYSVREGTKAEQFEDTVPEEEKLSRLNYILGIQKEINRKVNEKYLGREVKVLFTRGTKKDPGLFVGTTDNNKKVYVKTDKNLTGKILKAKLKELRGNSFIGTIN